VSGTGSKRGIGTSLREAGRELRAVLLATHKMAPVAGCMIAVIGVGAIAACSITPAWRMAFVVIVMTVLSVAIYAKTAKFGEAILGFVAGMLAAFSVEWQPAPFAWFGGALVAFLIVSLLIGSIRLAAEKEDILLHAAVLVDSDRVDELRPVLEEATSQVKSGLGPIEQAETARELVFRGVPVEIVSHAVRAVATLTVLTKEDHLAVARFIASVLTIAEADSEEEVELMLNGAYALVRSCARPPGDVVAAFSRTQHLVASGRAGYSDFVLELGALLRSGTPLESIAEQLAAQFPAGLQVNG